MIWFSDFIALVQIKVRILEEYFTMSNNMNIFEERYGTLNDQLCDVFID